MKKLLSYIIAPALALAALAGCAENPEARGGEGEGRVVLTTGFEKLTRAGDNTPADLVVKIAKKDVGYTHIFKDGAPVPKDLWLKAGDYSIEVSAGSFTEPSWAEGLVYASKKEFTVTAGGEVAVDVSCKPLNTYITLAFDPTVAEHLTNYSATIFPITGDDDTSFAFDAANTATAEGARPATLNIKLAEGQTAVKWVFNGEHKVPTAGDATLPITKSLNLVAGSHYTGTIKFTQHGSLDMFDIEIDDSTTEIETPITIKPTGPAIKGIDFSKAIIPSDAGTKMTLTSQFGIKEIGFSGGLFGSVFILDPVAGTTNPAGVDVAAHGIAVAAIDKGYELTLSKAFFDGVITRATNANNLKGSITAYDKKEGKTKVDMTVALGWMNAPVASDVWATHAKVTGIALKEGARFGYKAVGASGSWTYIDATRDEATKVCSATIKGLTPAKAYEVDIEVGGALSGAPVTITTDAAPQLPNSDFEGWVKKEKSWYPAQTMTEIFWGTANPGLSLAAGEANQNPTIYDTDVRTGSSGAKSVVMRSKYVFVVAINKFAAGNIFTGEFGKIDMTKFGAEVNFGQPFTARPSALKGWYKSNSGTITHAGAGSPKAVGEADEFHIFAALTTWTGRHKVQTWDPATFLKFDTDDVVAYGELTGKGSVENWTECNIPLKYRHTDRTPTYIVIVACSSKYGDYFTGSTDSWLKLDDMELVYDENIEMQ